MAFFKYCRFQRSERHLTIELIPQSVNCSTGELHWELVYLIDRYRPDTVDIDFSQVSYFSTEAINDLLRARKHLLGKGGVLKLVGMQAGVFAKFRTLRLVGHVFDITCLDKHLVVGGEEGLRSHSAASV